MHEVAMLAWRTISAGWWSWYGAGALKRMLFAVGFLLVTALAVPALAGPTDPGGTFVDDNGSVHEANIEAVAAEGITVGCNPPDNDEFCPGDPVSRGQMAAFLVRALDLHGRRRGQLLRRRQQQRFRRRHRPAGGSQDHPWVQPSCQR